MTFEELTDRLDALLDASDDQTDDDVLYDARLVLAAIMLSRILPDGATNLRHLASLAFSLYHDEFTIAEAVDVIVIPDAEGSPS